MSPQTIRDEIARAININVQNIIKVEYWSHQIWVNITGKGGRIVSYRILPAWLQQIIITIRDCTSLEQILALGDIFKVEIQRFPQYYAVEPWKNSGL